MSLSPGAKTAAQSLHDLMFEECRAMARHALSSGREVPASVIQTIARLERASDESEGQDDDESETSEKRADPLIQLATAHQQLVKIVAPATPQAIVLLAREAAIGGFFRKFGSTPLIRMLMFSTLSFLVLLVLLGMTDYTTISPGTDGGWSIYASSGLEMLARLLYLIAAAGLGACFAALFRANKFITDNTYDPKYATSYWIRLLMGVVSGVLLCEMIPLGDDPTLQGIGKPSLALLGGFSGNTVYRILERLVLSLESFVGGDVRGAAEAQLHAAKSQAGQKAAEKQAALTARLAALRQQLDTDDGAANAKQQLDTMLTESGTSDHVAG